VTDVFDRPHAYFIATNHPEFEQQRFPAGSTVVDPWGVIQDPGLDVDVHAIGRNKPVMISLLVPSRGRPEAFARMIISALETATYPRRLEVIAYVDEDDPKWGEYYVQEWQTRIEHRSLPRNPLRLIGGDRIVLSEMWNRCYEQARGEIFMHCGDDIVFRTPGWDQMVRDEFDRWPDKIVLVQGDDMSPNREVLATHGFLHKRWVETVGYFVPPLFSSDWNDVWLTDVADQIERRVRLPFITEHMHYGFGKAEYDETYRQREERGVRDGVADLYKRTARDRKNDAEKLRAVMA